MRKPGRGKVAGRSVQAQKAHFRSGAGAMGGSKKLQVKRKRQDDRREEREVDRVSQDA